MKYFIEYLNFGVMDNTKIIAPCGDRATILLDGRMSLSNMIAVGHECNGHERPKYPYFRIVKGENLIRGLRLLWHNLPDNYDMPEL